MRTSRQADRIGVVVHGPEVIDSGAALEVLDILENLGRVCAVLGGTMGRVAVIDGGLEDRIDISQRRAPSDSLRDLQLTSDYLVILNQAKSMETAVAFGSMVAARACVDIPLVQVDWGGRFVAMLSGDDQGLAMRLAQATGLELLDKPVPEQVLEEGTLVVDGNVVSRWITGVCPGELISVNGTVVARATASSVCVSAKDGKITDFQGAKIKVHGLGKLPPLDLAKAIIRSGEIRRTEHEPRFLDQRGRDLVVIDHAAEGALEASRGAAVVISVGDDTTAIAGDILARLGIPLIGIVDGDLDGLSKRTRIPKGCHIIRVLPGNDDVVGMLVKEMLLGGEERAPLTISLEELVEVVLKIAGNRLVRPDST